jgi:hypothetical protein
MGQEKEAEAEKREEYDYEDENEAEDEAEKFSTSFLRGTDPICERLSVARELTCVGRLRVIQKHQEMWNYFWGPLLGRARENGH